MVRAASLSLKAAALAAGLAACFAPRGAAATSAANGAAAGSAAAASSSLPGHTFTLPLKEYVTLFESPSADGGKRKRLHVSEYYGRVSFGTPPQVFDMVFDTGSGNVVLPTAKCSDEACQRHRRFVSADSRSSVQLALDDGTPMGPGETDRDSTTITYGTGKLTGEYIRDRICMGDGTVAPGSQTQPVCNTVNFLGVIQESRFPFVELPFDGIFGLGLAGLSASSNFNYVNMLRTSSTASDPTFAVFLRNLGKEEDSEITFGGWRPERLEDPDDGLKWLPVNRDEADGKGYWLVTMRDVYVRGEALGLCDDFSQSPRCKVAMDTGSSLMMGPPFAVTRLLEALGACSAQMPVLRFEFDAAAGGTFDVILRPEDYAELSAEGCAVAFQGIELPPTLGPMWVLGQTALRKYYSVYDSKRWRVGIGLARHTSTPRVEAGPPTPPPTTAPIKLEACEDDDADMESNQLPGCRSFTNMGYCKRFPPLAHHYCRQSCNLCSKPRPLRASSMTLGGRESGPQAGLIGQSRLAQVSPVLAGSQSFLKADAPSEESDATEELTVPEPGLSMSRLVRHRGVLSMRGAGSGRLSLEA